MSKILIVEDNRSLCEVLATFLKSEGYQLLTAESAEEAKPLLEQHVFELVVTDLKLPGQNGLDFLRESREVFPELPFLVMTAYGNMQLAVEAMKLGASDFIAKPFEPSTLNNAIEQILECGRVLDRSNSTQREKERILLTQSPKMEAVLQQARRLAPLASSVLILGESGTGKELVAHYVHQHSQRSDKNFVALNCASMPDELLESELFGHEAGSFTGATQRRLGLFEVADKGSLFLDEIGNMPQNLQVKLLRAVQEGQFRRLGNNSDQNVDTRIISATNCNLEDEIAQGHFREDLFYRLGVISITLPPLRERPEDIELLANYFLKVFSEKYVRPTDSIDQNSLELFHQYHWPGNIRELENALERSIVFSNKKTLTRSDFSFIEEKLKKETSITRGLLEISKEAAQEAEKQAINTTLKELGGNKSRTAKALSVSYKTLLNKIKEYNL